ncbi:MAG: hypothetical protein ICV66_09010, partial [Chitinophagaceae bacterium]|nr:hypothetical protein [Chitinophagaceae bacterium]
NNVPVSAVSSSTTQTKPDHIVFVWFENKGFSKIVGSSAAPYINSLIKKGVLFTNTYAITHPSYPNYVAWFSGSTQGITTDACIDGKPFGVQTLYNALNNKAISFRWYSESMPSDGYTGCSYGYYREKHNPTTIFSTVPDYVNKVYQSTSWQSGGPTFFSGLPKVVCVTPNMINDMHDGTITQGDNWLKKNFDAYIKWANSHNSILVIYWDEADGSSTSNKIPVTLVGQHIKENITISKTYNHYSFTKWVCSLYGASTGWASNINNAAVPTGFWK